MKRISIFPAVLLVLSSCRSTRTVYVHANADLGSVKKVAVLPFENLTQERSAADKVSKIFLTELLALSVFDVAEPGAVTRLMRSEHVESTEALAPADLKRLGETLKVDALFLGSVVDFGESRGGTTATPEVTIQLRLVEVASGVTIWSTSQTKSGTTVSGRLFGIGGDSVTEAARKVVRRELKTLLK